jgi:acetyl-CoA carboxylase carboxyl transferase subunit alpha
MGSSLEFESQISHIENKIKELQEIAKEGDVNMASEIAKMQTKVNKMLENLYRKLTPWQRVQVARHPDRPKFRDYLQSMFTDFVELLGDRLFADDQAIIGGFGKIDGIKCVVIGQEKGSDTESRLKHNFGMAGPEGYRKVVRLLDLADKFSLPVLTFVDTSGAFPGIGSEERSVAEAIARCIEKSLQIKVPIISVIIGEGGSGGAIAIATSDYVLMLENSIYSVISPEGCASILWKDERKSEVAAEVQKLTAGDLLPLRIIDSIICEPIGGAHRNKREATVSVKAELLKYLRTALDIQSERRIGLRRKKYTCIGDQFLVA